MLITTSVVNTPKFIELQDMCFKKFFVGDYHFVVYNDAKDWPDFSNYYDSKAKYSINKTCNRLNIPVKEIPNQHHKDQQCAVWRCADACNAMLSDHLNATEPVLCLDSDMFLVATMKEDNYNAYEAAGVPQSRDGIHYIWNGLHYFNIPMMNNKHLLNWNPVPKTDVGGGMKDYILATPSEKIYYIPHTCSDAWTLDQAPATINNEALASFFKNDPRNIGDKLKSEIYDDMFLHYCTGGNWEHRNALESQKRIDVLIKAVTNLCRG